MSQSQASASFKVVLLGEGIELSTLQLESKYFNLIGCVGKSSIVLRYVDDKFNTGHLTTLQVCSPRYHVQASIGVRDMSCIWEHEISRVTMLHTLQAAFMMKKLVVTNTRVSLSIWDTAGQERFHALGPIYYRDAHGEA